ncbi:transporter substrate-binding domain-containing protein [Nitratifractor sp.]|uniref:ATP-binding protein n=1 Tax=Nitratifractor sp. TaxID=2268144 RepID=UPI0025EC14D5|nr:transporter substrate-binding domain-containing protein [Nitratifractor sp.]
MRTWWRIIALLSILASTLWSTEEPHGPEIRAGKEMLSQSERAFLRKKQAIRMCVDPHWMPMEHVDSQGRYEGILADFSRLISRKLGIPFRLVRTPDYQTSRRYLKEGRCDIIMGEQATPEVLKHYLATRPYYRAPRAFVTHVDATLVHNFSQIAHSGPVGVLKNSPAETLLPKLYPGIRLVAMKDGDAGLRKVASKELVAFVNIIPSLVYSIQQQGLSNLKIAGTLPDEVKLSMLVNKNEAPLVPILNKAIGSISQQERQKILSRWVQIRYAAHPDHTGLIRLLLLLGLLSVILLAWLYHTRRMHRALQQVHRELEAKFQKELEKNRQHQLMLLQQNRLAQKGQILNMIAHQWRQPLNTLSIASQLCLYQMRKESGNNEILDHFEEKSRSLIEQMSKTIDAFRDFFRPERSKVRFSVNQVIEELFPMVQPLYEQRGIELEWETEEGIFYVGYPKELGQALLNILYNASQVIRERGIERGRVEVSLRREEDQILLEICDNAGGISDEIIGEIFDPYFSTKDSKNGTGLGLYMSKLIVEEHMGGRLEVYNGVEGACFRIRFPLIESSGD